MTLYAIIIEIKTEQWATSVSGSMNILSFSKNKKKYVMGEVEFPSIPSNVAKFVTRRTTIICYILNQIISCSIVSSQIIQYEKN